MLDSLRCDNISSKRIFCPRKANAVSYGSSAAFLRRRSGRSGLAPGSRGGAEGFIAAAVGWSVSISGQGWEGCVPFGALVATARLPSGGASCRMSRPGRDGTWFGQGRLHRQPPSFAATREKMSRRGGRAFVLDPFVFISMCVPPYPAQSPCDSRVLHFHPEFRLVKFPLLCNLGQTH